LSLRQGFELRTIGFIDAVAASGGLSVRECGIFAGGRVAIVADEVHGLMIAEDDVHLATLASSFPLQLLEVADDLKRIRPTIGDVPKLHEDSLATRPMAARIGDARAASDILPSLEVAVEVANGNDPLRLLREQCIGKAGGKRRERHR